jgi:hypothetical protein
MVSFGVYDFETVRVRDRPALAGEACRSMLRPAPKTSAELGDYAAEVADAFLNLDNDDRDRNCKLTIRW